MMSNDGPLVQWYRYLLAHTPQVYGFVGSASTKYHLVDDKTDIPWENDSSLTAPPVVLSLDTLTTEISYFPHPWISQTEFEQHRLELLRSVRHFPTPELLTTHLTLREKFEKAKQCIHQRCSGGQPTLPPFDNDGAFILRKPLRYQGLYYVWNTDIPKPLRFANLQEMTNSFVFDPLHPVPLQAIHWGLTHHPPTFNVIENDGQHCLQRIAKEVTAWNNQLIDGQWYVNWCYRPPHLLNHGQYFPSNFRHHPSPPQRLDYPHYPSEELIHTMMRLQNVPIHWEFVCAHTKQRLFSEVVNWVFEEYLLIRFPHHYLYNVMVERGLGGLDHPHPNLLDTYLRTFFWQEPSNVSDLHPVKTVHNDRELCEEWTVLENRMVETKDLTLLTALQQHYPLSYEEQQWVFRHYTFHADDFSDRQKQLLSNTKLSIAVPHPYPKLFTMGTLTSLVEKPSLVLAPIDASWAKPTLSDDVTYCYPLSSNQWVALGLANELSNVNDWAQQFPETMWKKIIQLFTIDPELWSLQFRRLAKQGVKRGLTTAKNIGYATNIGMTNAAGLTAFGMSMAANSTNQHFQRFRQSLPSQQQLYTGTQQAIQKTKTTIAKPMNTALATLAKPFQANTALTTLAKPFQANPVLTRKQLTTSSSALQPLVAPPPPPPEERVVIRRRPAPVQKMSLMASKLG